MEERTPLLIKELPVAEKILSSAKKLEDKYPKEVISALKKDGDSFYDNIFGPAGVSSSNFAKEQAKKKKEVSADDLFLLYQSRIKELLEQEQNFDTYQEALNVIEEYKDVDISRMEKEEKDFISFIQKSKKDIIAFPRIQQTIGEANPQESDDYKAFAKRFKELDPLEKEINSLDIKIVGQENIDQLKANYSEAVKETEDALNQKIHQFLNNSDKGYEDFIAFEKDFKPIGFDENSRKHIDLDDGKYDLLSKSGTIAKNWKSTFISEDAYAHDAKGGLSHAKKFDKSVIGSSYDEVLSRYRSIIGKGRKAAFGAGVGSFFGGIGAALQVILGILLILIPLALIGLQAYESVMELALPEGNWVGGIIGGIFYGIVRAAGSMFGLPFLVPSFYHATLLDANL
ncbi:MAG: hypothetical protein J6038_00050, partial [Bacilli bacterium]|nr:hypothetical protein [Bacilli bacterium]